MMMMPSVPPDPSQATVRSRIWMGPPVVAELLTYAADARTKLIGPCCLSTVPLVVPPTYSLFAASTMPLVSRQVPPIWSTVPGALASIAAWSLAASPGLSRHATPDRPGIAVVVASTTTVRLVLVQAASARHAMAIHSRRLAIQGDRQMFMTTR